MTRRVRPLASPAWLGLLPVAVVLAQGGCGSDPREQFVRAFDAGLEADANDERAPDVDPTLGGPCTEDASCDDAVPCTSDSCDKTLLRCRNVPDDTLCADPMFCNGREKCVPRLGCAAGAVVTCQDDNPCTIDRCVEATKGCEHKQRDLDGDGDPDYHCVGNADCDDLDPTVNKKGPEVCGNFKDDNCDGVIDTDPAGCQAPANDVCATALPVTAAGTYLLTTVASKRDYATKCTVKNTAAARDIVMKITVPAGSGPKDVEIWATPAVAANEVAVALRKTSCTTAVDEIGCDGVAAVLPSARRIVRGAMPGDVYYAIVTTQTDGALDVKVDFLPPTTPPTNEGCSAPTPVLVDTPITARIIDAGRDHETACDRAKTGELSYSFTLPEARDVRIFASTLLGNGEPVVSLRTNACSEERSCRVGAVPSLFARGLPGGVPQVFTVAGTTQLDANVVVKTYPATPKPANQECATAPLLAFTPPTGSRQTTFEVDLSKQEDAIKNGCLPGGPAAAYTLELTEDSDVLVIGRFPSNETGSVSINKEDCTVAVPCTMGPTPQRVSGRKLKGTYRIVIADTLAQTVQLSVLVRPYAPPASVGLSDNCVTPFTLPAVGGFFTGDTTTSTADYGAGCDAPGQAIGTAKDQIMKLVLPVKQRVVLDMTGSFFTTLLDVRKGPACPGAEMPGTCFVGFTANKSFLDVLLDAGTYWVQVDGYNGDHGPWNLDLRVLPVMPLAPPP